MGTTAGFLGIGCSFLYEDLNKQSEYIHKIIAHQGENEAELSFIKGDKFYYQFSDDYEYKHNEVIAQRDNFNVKVYQKKYHKKSLFTDLFINDKNRTSKIYCDSFNKKMNELIDKK
ncbi:hypothetical protein AAEX28_03080 [Lentisphaerota bacterium WC36G]|nr:hypothetical protein LJT99_05960 [Lentisphaerae bacterium WC36]